MKKTLLIISIALFVSQSLWAQFNIIEQLELKNAENIKKNTLVVVLLTEDEKYLKKLTKKKPEEVEKYKNQIQTYNSDIQALVPKLLHISKNVQFKTLAEVELMTFEERANYTFMLLGYYSPAFNDMKGSMPRIDFHSKKGPQKSIESYYAIESLFDNKLTYYLRWEFYTSNEKEKNSQLVFYKNLPNIFVSQADIAFGLDQTQLKFESTLSKKNIELNPQILKEKILLINKDNLDEKTTEAEIKAKYPYKFAIVQKEEFEKALLEKDPKYCSLLIVPTFITPIPLGIVMVYHINFAQEIIDTSNGYPAYFSLASAYVYGVSKSYEKVTADNIIELTKKIN